MRLAVRVEPRINMIDNGKVSENPPRLLALQFVAEEPCVVGGNEHGGFTPLEPE